MIHRIAAWLFVLLALFASQARAANDIDVTTQLYWQGRYHELLAMLQTRVDAGQKLPIFYLSYLAEAQYGVRQYRAALAVADEMERRIAAGDNLLGNLGGSGRVMAAAPPYYRAAVALDLGAYEDALRYGAEALAKAASIRSDGWVILIQGVVGVANAFLGRTDEARKSLEVLRGTATGDNGPEKFTAIARIHMALKEYDRALAAINDPGAETKKVFLFRGTYDGTSREVPKSFIRAKCLYETGALSQAKAAYDQLLKLQQIEQLGGVYWGSLHDRARIALREGDIPGAIEFLKKAVEAIERQRSSIDSEAGRIGFVGDKQAVYQALVSTLVAKGDAAAALGYVERSKARALVDMLAGKRDFSVTEGSAQRVGELLAAADTAAVAARGIEPTAEATAAKRSVARARNQELAQAAPELSSLVTVSAADAATLQQLLPADETLVEYFYAGDELYAFVATREAVSATRLDGRGLNADIGVFRRAIQDPAASRWEEPAKKLYGRLVAPIRERLRTPNLLVVAHGALHYLPFNALHDGSGFLVESYAIRLLPAATALKFLKADPAEKPGTLLAFGNPDLGDKSLDLPFAQAEAEEVAKTLPRSRALVRRDATRAAFRKYAADFRFIHIASHGDFDAERPLASSLLLARDGTDDGRLTVSDLYSMRVDASLVTLSACETGLGKVANGDDVVGLTRGFLYAGTRTIVASLWPVDDRATGDLMTAFYRSLGKGLSKREALRAAQREQLKRQSHPFFWAAFQLTGNP